MAVFGGDFGDPGDRDLSPGSGDSGAGPGTGVWSADPPNRYDGMFWVRSDLTELRFQVGGTVQAVTLAAGGGGGPYAPLGSTYVTIAADATLTSERILTGTSEQIAITDGGAGGNVTLSFPTNINVVGRVQMTEITAPAAPAANFGRVFLQDNGAGKTQLAVIFNTGAAQIIATEP